MRHGQQQKQQRERGENKLQHPRTFQRADKHKQREDAPQKQPGPQKTFVGGVREAHFRQQQNCHKA